MPCNDLRVDAANYAWLPACREGWPIPAIAVAGASALSAMASCCGSVKTTTQCTREASNLHTGDKTPICLPIDVPAKHKRVLQRCTSVVHRSRANKGECEANGISSRAGGMKRISRTLQDLILHERVERKSMSKYGKLENGK